MNKPTTKPPKPEPRWTTPRDTQPTGDWKELTPEQRQRIMTALHPTGGKR